MAVLLFARSCLGVRAQIALDRRSPETWHDLWEQQILAGHAADRLDDPAKAQLHYEAAIATMQTLSDSDTSNEVWQDDLRYSFSRAGRMAVNQRDWATAEEHYDAALRIARRLAGLAPDDIDRQIVLVTAYYSSGATKNDRTLEWATALRIIEELMVMDGLTDEQIASLDRVRALISEQ